MTAFGTKVRMLFSDSSLFYRYILFVVKEHDTYIYHASDKIVGILLDRSRSHDAMKITVLGVKIRIGCVIEFEAGDEQSKMADHELVAMDIS